MINPFVPNVPFLYTLEISENLKIFWCFQGVEKRWIEIEWVKTYFYWEPKKPNKYGIEKHNNNCKGISFVKCAAAAQV